MEARLQRIRCYQGVMPIRKLKIITTHIGWMGSRVPKERKGFGQSTISQVRPELIWLEIGGTGTVWKRAC